MTLRESSLALLFGALLAVPGCIDPTSVGQETDDAGSESGDSSGSDTSSSASSTTGSSTQTDGSGSETEPGTDTNVGCPPIDIAPCIECECIGGEWSCSNDGCTYDCTGQACGDACMMCPEEDPECTSPEYEGVCSSDGQCVPIPPPEQALCEGALEPGFETGLDETYGCADVVVYAYNTADEQAIVLWVDQGLAQDAIDMGMPTHAELPATDPTVHLDARAGISVTGNECNDVPFPGVEIHETWLPTGGTVIVDVVPDGMGTATATVQLVDVQLERELPGPDPLTVNLMIEDVNVGWYPG